MQIRIVAVGKIKEKFLQDGIAEYEKRLRPYVKLLVAEIADEKRPASASTSVESLAKEKEGERILFAIPSGAFVVSLDVHGLSWSSEDLAVAFREWELAGKSQVAFVIGGDLGLSSAVLNRSDLRLSLSRMTFTHQWPGCCCWNRYTGRGGSRVASRIISNSSALSAVYSGRVYFCEHSD